MTTNEPSSRQFSAKGLGLLHESMAGHVAARDLPGLITLVARTAAAAEAASQSE